MAIAGPAQASLGAGAPSLELDRVHLNAKMAKAAGTNFTVTALTLPNGGVTKEFSDLAGTVFAVAWHGPSRPDLRQMLGVRFETFQKDATAADHATSRRRPLESSHPDLMVHSGGRSGGFWGYAYLPQSIPAGFSARDLR